MQNWWKDLSVAKKLSVVVGGMGLLIAAELLTLYFAMNTLSGIRAFVAGESYWSKAQKNAIFSLNRYAQTRDPKYYEEYLKTLAVSAGDQVARLELEKADPDLMRMREGLMQGQGHPQDVEQMISFLLRFKNHSEVQEAMESWKKGDSLIQEIRGFAQEIHDMISSGSPEESRIQAIMLEIDSLNEQLTQVERQFSENLGEGSRWMENALLTSVLLTVLIAGAIGLLLSISFGRNLTRTLKELTHSAAQVGQGNFEVQAPVRSQDELGHLAQAINKMATDLRQSLGQKDQAENANQVKTLFLASMSHEIRTPLGVMLGLVDILKDPKLPWPERLKYTETVERTGKNLTRIINDILDISKVETGHFEIEMTTFSLSEFLNDVQTMMRIKAEKQNNVLHFVPQGPVPEKVHTDRIRLRQILVNLINNALKFTKNGTVHVNYSWQDPTLKFEVVDNGSGIPEKDQSRLFRPYYQSAEGKQKAEGTGLGLVLSKRLAEALGGDVRLKESRLGQGSTFVATIKSPEMESTENLRPSGKVPAANVNSRVESHSLDDTAKESTHRSPEGTEKRAPSPVPSKENSLSGKVVLVVEDVLDNQMLTRLYLSRKGMKVQFANNGAEGVQKALNGQYDLILMDMQMPIMDGYTATKNLREAGYQKPIIAVTAHAMKEDKEKCMAAGCDDYLTKPLDSQILYQVIQKSLRPNGGPETLG